MSDLPTMPESQPAPKGKAPKSAPAPDLLFVENTRTSLVTLRYHDAEHPVPGLAASKFLGPGMNLISQRVVDACTPKGGEFADGLRGALVLVRPLELRTHEAISLAQRTGSRQALHAWRKVEKRADVLAAIDQRLAPKAAKAAAVEDDDAGEYDED